MIINGSQSTNPGTKTKFMQHPYIGRALTMREMGEATPRPMLRQQSGDSIIAVDPAQRSEQVRPPQLRRIETTSPPDTSAPRQQLVDKIIRHMSRNQFQ